MGCGSSTGGSTGVIVDYPYQPTGRPFIDDAVKQGKAVLGYWEFRGRGQGVRTLLDHLQVPYVDRVYNLKGMPPDIDRSEWQNEKEHLGLAFPNLPYYIDNHAKVTESQAVYIYICRKHRLEYLGRDQVEVAAAVTLWNIIAPIKNQYVTEFVYNPNPEAARPELQQKVQELFRNVDKSIGQKNYSCSASGPTWVDFSLLEDICLVEKMAPGCIQNLPPSLKRVYDNMLNLPNVRQSACNNPRKFLMHFTPY